MKPSLTPLPVLLCLLLLQSRTEAHAQIPAPEDRAAINEAIAAAPPVISAGAEVRGWDGAVLRRGTNEWVCFPRIPDMEGNTAMCLDEPWLAWVDAW